MSDRNGKNSPSELRLDATRAVDSYLFDGIPETPTRHFATNLQSLVVDRGTRQGSATHNLKVDIDLREDSAQAFSRVVRTVDPLTKERVILIE